MKIQLAFVLAAFSPRESEGAAGAADPQNHRRRRWPKDPESSRRCGPATTDESSKLEAALQGPNSIEQFLTWKMAFKQILLHVLRPQLRLNSTEIHRCMQHQRFDWTFWATKVWCWIQPDPSRRLSTEIDWKDSMWLRKTSSYSCSTVVRGPA